MPATASPSEAPVLSGALLRRFDVAGPRYTSYPTADRFVEAFGADDYRRGLAQHAEGAAIGGCPPLSLYVHVPFCESICYYCACNKVITEHHERAAEYLDALEREIALHTVVLGSGQPVSQLYLGGGTPTFLNDAELERLMASIRRNFALVAGAETSIEVDPRTVSGERLAFLAKLGFNPSTAFASWSSARARSASSRSMSI
jgi:oxygen-independent coproporphyrinogen III oxidase